MYVVRGIGHRKWCGPACVDAFKLRCDPSRQRNFVVVRDAGVCRLCGRDTVAAEAEAERVGLGTYLMRGREESDYEFEARRRLHDAKLLALGYARGCWREVDHREPVVDGGGLCDPSSLRLLCGACHLRVTVESGRHRRLGGVA